MHLSVRIIPSLLRAFTKRNVTDFGKLNTFRTGSFKLFKRQFLGFLTILTL